MWGASEPEQYDRTCTPHLLSDNGENLKFNAVELVKAGPCSGCGQALSKPSHGENLRILSHESRVYLKSHLEEFAHSNVVEAIRAVEDNTLEGREHQFKEELHAMLNPKLLKYVPVPV